MLNHLLIFAVVLSGCTFTGDTASQEMRARQEARAIQPVDLADIGTRIDAIRDSVEDGAGEFADEDARDAFADRLDRLDARLVVVLKHRDDPDFAAQVLQLDSEITAMEDYLVESEALDH